MDFLLSVADSIYGDQLADEINQIPGVDIGQGASAEYTFRSPLTVTIFDELAAGFEAEIAAVVMAHVPDPDYFADVVERRDSVTDAQSAIAAWKALPGWSDWTVEQAVQWIDDNVTTTDPDTKKVLKDLATMAILTRDVVEWLYVSRLRGL